jgi:hypothetical protein
MITTSTGCKDMDTQPKADELARLEAINRELCQRIVDLEAEVDRKNKAVEGFMAENEALKQELGGKGRNAPPVSGRGQSDFAARIDRWRTRVKGATYDGRAS